MSYPYYGIFRRLSPAVISKAISLFAEIELSGESNEFAVLSVAWRQSKDQALRHELAALLNAEIRQPGAVIPL